LIVIEIGLCGKPLLIVSCGSFGERNRRTFEDEEISMQDIKHSFLRMLFEFCATIGGVLCSSIVDFFGLYNVFGGVWWELSMEWEGGVGSLT
jgi:hypothetical protein